MSTFTPEETKLDDILRWFSFDHLPERLQEIPRQFAMLARFIVDSTQRSPERTVALRKLLESKDAAVRASIEVLR